MAGHPGNADPATQPPDPLRQFPCVVRKRIILPVDAAYPKKAVGYFMGRPDGVFLETIVYQQSPDFRPLCWPRLRHDAYRLPLSQNHRVWFGCGHSAAKACPKEQPNSEPTPRNGAHRVGNYMTLASEMEATPMGLRQRERRKNSL